MTVDALLCKGVQRSPLNGGFDIAGTLDRIIVSDLPTTVEDFYLIAWIRCDNFLLGETHVASYRILDPDSKVLLNGIQVELTHLPNNVHKNLILVQEISMLLVQKEGPHSLEICFDGKMIHEIRINLEMC